MPGLANGHWSCSEAFGGFCGLANGRLEPPLKDNAGAGKRHGSCREAFGMFCGQANGSIEQLLKDNAGAGKRHGSCREAFGGFWRVSGLANGSLERLLFTHYCTRKVPLSHCYGLLVAFACRSGACWACWGTLSLRNCPNFWSG